jgi:DNA-nicking Smr family endonuclease
MLVLYFIHEVYLFALYPFYEATRMSNDNLSDEDKALFRRMMHEVKPLGKNNTLLMKAALPLANIIPKRALHEKQPTDYNLSNYYQDVVNSDSVLTYCKQSIPRRRLHQLKSGQIPWQARLDLHGLRPDAARESLCHFIAHQLQLENRCLLIIHGKGGLYGEAPILKNHVNHWLQQLPEVLAFHSALARDGGSGALYVLLQRQR